MKTELEEMGRTFVAKKEEMSILESVLHSKETEISKLHSIVSAINEVTLI